MMWQKLLKGETILDTLKEILLEWELKDYPSDEQRWKEYAKDIQDLVDRWEGDEDYDVDWDASSILSDYDDSKAAMAGAVMASHAGIESKPIYGKKKRDDEE